MGSLSIQPVTYSSPASLGNRTDKENSPQQRPDVKAVTFEKGPSVGSKKDEVPSQKTKNSDKTSPDGMKNALDTLESKAKEKEHHLVFNHEVEQLIWEESDPTSGKKQHFPLAQATRAYDKMQSQGEQDLPETAGNSLTPLVQEGSDL